jgi:ribosomal protein L35
MMPKLKTRKSATKRLAKVTASGKLIRRKTLAQHLVKRKTKRTIKSSGKPSEVVASEVKKLKRLTPYRTK